MIQRAISLLTAFIFLSAPCFAAKKSKKERCEELLGSTRTHSAWLGNELRKLEAKNPNVFSLTRDEELELASQIRAPGKLSSKAAARFAESVYPMILKYAADYAYHYKHVTLDDMFQVGTLAAMRVAGMFDPNHESGAKFSTYVDPHLRNEMTKEAKRTRTQLGRSGWKAKDVRRMSFSSIDHPVANTDSTKPVTFGDRIADDESLSPESRLLDIETNPNIEKFRATLDPERQFIFDHSRVFLGTLTYKEVALQMAQAFGGEVTKWQNIQQRAERIRRCLIRFERENQVFKENH
jgi:RNA polymerase sigma factor (sigma-70 family)